MLKDHPEIKVAFDKLWDEKLALVAKVKPLREEYDKLHAEATKINLRMKEITAKRKAITHPRLVEIDEKLSAMARATGGKALNEGSL